MMKFRIWSQDGGESEEDGFTHQCSEAVEAAEYWAETRLNEDSDWAHALRCGLAVQVRHPGMAIETYVVACEYQPVFYVRET